MKTNWPDDRIHDELMARDPARPEALVGAEAAPQARMLLAEVVSDTDNLTVATAPGKRRLAFAGLAAAATVAVAIALTLPSVARTPSQRHPNTVELVAFSRSGGNIVAAITDPLAAASQLDAVFRSHGIDISVQVLPVSPSLVGSIVSVSSPTSVNIAPIHAGACLAGGTQCVVRLVIPEGFHGPADVSVGRAAQPGEHYASADDSFGPGEALHCSGILNNTVRFATQALNAKGLTAEWRIEGVSPSHDVNNPPASDYVVDGTPISATTVMLWIAPHAYQAGNQFLHNAQTGC